MHGLGVWQDARIGLALFWVLVGPFVDLPALRRLKVNSTTAGRVMFFRMTTAYLMGAGLLSWWMMEWGGTARWVWQMPHLGILGSVWLKVILAVMAVAFFCLAFQPAVTLLFHPNRQKTYTKAVAKSGLAFMMPRGSVERRWWFAVSLSAGVFEELIFRGFLLQVARMELGLGLVLGLLLTSVVFGFNHLYQGSAGILRTGVTGLVLGIVAVLTGGLLLPMVLHAALDSQILLMYRPEDEPISAENIQTTAT